MASVLNGKFTVALGVSKKHVCYGVSGERAIKVVVTLRVSEYILILVITHELAAEFQVMGAFGPGEIVSHLVIRGSVKPGPGSWIVVNAV